MIQDAFGKDVDNYPICSSFIASTYDTTFIISPGRIGTHYKYNDMLVSSVHYNKTQMYYKKYCDNDDDDDENEKVCKTYLYLYW